MFWTYLQGAVNFVFLLLAVTLLSLLWSNTQDLNKDANMQKHFEIFKESVHKAMSNNIQYVETRINKIAQNSDDYQVSTSNRLYVLEDKVKKLEQDNKASSRNININTNTATSN